MDMSLKNRRSDLTVLLLQHAAWPSERLLQAALCAAVRWGSKNLVKKLVAGETGPGRNISMDKARTIWLKMPRMRIQQE